MKSALLQTFGLLLLQVVQPLFAQTPPPATPIGHPSFLSPHASPIVVHQGRVYVVNTPADTVDAIDARSGTIEARIDVGIDPVSLAVRPDGEEIWVANHVSDSVSVIDTNPKSLMWLHVIATVQDLDTRSKATRFDEPVGIAFASNAKAYVALSSENAIAVVDVAKRKVTKRLAITAQDPRAIIVRKDRLYVLPFESNNKTQLSGGYKIDNKLVTFNAHEHSIANNNVLSLGHVLDIIKHPRVPDRDLYIFDTQTDKLIQTVDTLGTLLYGLAVDSKGEVFVAQADARNDANGRSGTKKHGLAELENRAFLNQITRVSFKGGTPEKPSFIELEPLPPKHPLPKDAFATPFGIQVSDDDATLFVTAAGSDKLFSVNTATGKVLDQVDVDAVPRGIALESIAGKESRAWVFNAVANTVTRVNVSNPSKLIVMDTIALEDPSHPAFKRGRIAFNTASSSSTKTFSCASCHPDGHTDQLLWVLKTPIVSGGKQIMPRSTMPLRGLRDTAPFHWDGIPGDPYGGNNSASVHRSVAPNSELNVPTSAIRHLIDAGLASTMLQNGDATKNAKGQEGYLSAAQREDLSKFLLNITYPPAQRRAYSNVLSDRAKQGFDLFHIQGNHEGKPKPNVCGNCHRMPFWVSTNTPGTGMDAPTWRGAYDRFLILPQGRLNIIDFDFYRRVAEKGIPERDMWRFSWRSKGRFDPVWEMVLEGSTGFSGSFARQVSLNEDTASDALTHDLLEALEVSASEGGVVLQAEGFFLDNRAGPIKMQFKSAPQGGTYVDLSGYRKAMTREQLIRIASKGFFVGTFTGRHGAKDDYDHPQPALWTRGPLHTQRGRQIFPVLHAAKKAMPVSARHIDEGAHLIVDGRRVQGLMKREKKDAWVVHFETLPSLGMHFLQVQNPDGLFSNDFIFHVSNGEAVKANPLELGEELSSAVAQGQLSETKRLIKAGAPINARYGDSGLPPLSTAAYHGRLEIARYLLEKGATVSKENNDGNTPLHIAAFMGRTETVQLLLSKNADVKHRNKKKESPIDVVAGAWSDELAGFYTFLIDSSSLDVTVKQMRERRPGMAKLLRAAQK
ncbi:MAG: YVTN family beta-propeller protein [Verrucomicrobiales bacterium]|jgi:YVTN family beta-propeller protein